MNADELGKLAYDTYCGLRDWKSYKDEPLPQWPEVKPDIKAGWAAAASAVATQVRMDGHGLIGELNKFIQETWNITPTAKQLSTLVSLLDQKRPGKVDDPTGDDAWKG